MDTIRGQMTEQFGYKNLMQVPKIDKIVINMGVGDATQDKKLVDAAAAEMALIAGQKPVICKAKKSVAVPSSCAKACRSAARSRCVASGCTSSSTASSPSPCRASATFAGSIRSRSTGAATYAMGLKEQIVFPEINYDRIGKVRGMDVIITTTANTDDEARALLFAFGLPFTGMVDQKKAA